MAKIYDVEIIYNAEVTDNIYRLEVDAPGLAQVAEAGQFVQVKLADDFTLRRPLGIASTKNDRVTIFYRVVGEGTKYLSAREVGEHLDILGTLGNGFNTDIQGHVLLVGGGMGLAPLLSVAERLDAVDVLIGGKNKSEVVFWVKEFRPEVEKIYVTTDDGSFGQKGFVTDFLPEVLDYEYYSAIYTCGPEIMMYGVALESVANEILCYVSLERRMACGIGACLSCSVDTIGGRKKVCKDGPVFEAREVFDCE